jgi:integrase
MLKTKGLSAAQKKALAALLEQVTEPDAPKPKRPPRRRGETVKYLTEDELGRLFAVIESERDTAIFRLAYHRGLRATEISNLQLSDVDWKADRIRIDRLKGSASGQFHLCASEVRALRKWRRIRGDEPGALFPGRQRRADGKGVTQQRLDQLMKRYGALAGLPPEKCHMHTLKHTCGTHLLQRGESIEDVQDHLGHANVQNTLIYAKFTNQRRAARDRRLRDW